MKILCACEESQAVTIELRKRGHEAYSCDVLDCSGGYPEWHRKQDVCLLLEDDWDMIIAFPPCTHLAVSGAKHFKQKIADGRQKIGEDFFRKFTKVRCEKVAIENPVGIMSTRWMKPDQIIHPWQFGDESQKTTCLWLKGLPKLIPTNEVGRGKFYTSPKGHRVPSWYSNNKKKRSKTFHGIAVAMACQWG